MLVTSSQSSTQRPLGLSVEELYALDRQYRRIEQQQQHIAQLQAQTHLTSSNLNRLASRSLDFDLPPSTPATLPILPSLEIHGHNYSNRAQVHHHPRTNPSDQYRYISPAPPTPLLKYTYPQRTRANDVGHHQNYDSKYRTHIQVG